MDSFSTLADAMHDMAVALLKEGEQVPPVRESTSIGSGFGSSVRPTLEIIGHSFKLENPHAVLIDRPNHPVNMPYVFTNTLWAISGSNLVTDIEFWNSRARSFSDDGLTVRSAAGPRIFGGQFQSAIKRLREDSSSRRAAIMLIGPDDLTARTRDVPCTCSLQFLIREGRLHAVATMRSQSAMMVLPYDIPLLTSIQCVAAAELGIEPGSYFHTSASLHAYEDELEVLHEVASGSVSSVSIPPTPHLAELAELAVFEKQVRRSFEGGTIRSFAASALPGTAMDYSSIVRSILLGDALWRGGAAHQAKLAWATAGRIGQLAAARFDGKDTAL